MLRQHVLFRLDHCNSVLAGLPSSSVASLQRVLQASLRLMPLSLRCRKVMELHWLESLTLEKEDKITECNFGNDAIRWQMLKFLSDIFFTFLSKSARFRLWPWACPFLCRSVGVYVYLLLSRAKTKNVKKYVCRFWDLSSGEIPKIVLCDLVLLSKINSIKCYISEAVRASTKICGRQL